MASRKQKNFQVFLKDDEWIRYMEIYARAKERFERKEPEISKSYVVRRLMGLDPPDDLVTTADIEYFLNKPAVSAKIIPQLHPSTTNISESDTQPEFKQSEKIRKKK
jgi:hypothetical protein